MRLLRLLFVLPLLSAGAYGGVRPDEALLFFPSTARLLEDGGADVEVHAWIFEPEEDQEARNATIRLLASSFEVEGLESGACTLFPEHTRYFLVDNERRKQLTVQLAGSAHRLRRSGADGHSLTTVRLTPGELAAVRGIDPKGATLTFSTTPDGGDTRAFDGAALLLEPTGLSVISDIDDTIKISEVRDKHALMLNTFCRPFRAVPGMADLYRAWAEKSGARFHYVSASPWHLYPLLADLITRSQFPVGTWHMKDFRLKDRTVLSLTQDSTVYKPTRIDPLMKAYPGRRFVMVGDSGESDPEVYAGVARRFPGQVVRILIRDVTDESRDAARYKETFKDLPPALWDIFTDPATLVDSIPMTGSSPATR